MIGHYVKEHFHYVIAEAAWSGIAFDPFEKDIGINYSKPMPDWAKAVN